MGGGGSASFSPSAPQPGHAAAVSGEILPDLGLVNLRELINVPHPHNLEALKAMKQATPARIGVGHAGPRYLTSTLLRFRADHAMAMDAVFTEVGDDWVQKNNLPGLR
ncbi:hypothetical protein FACS189468_9500 [Spirochaetia bacterium]|nr:hypothetical protein FACS189468_9500 [Spirochaetia bacterium]